MCFKENIWLRMMVSIHTFTPEIIYRDFYFLGGFHKLLYFAGWPVLCRNDNGKERKKDILPLCIYARGCKGIIWEGQEAARMRVCIKEDDGWLVHWSLKFEYFRKSLSMQSMFKIGLNIIVYSVKQLMYFNSNISTPCSCTSMVLWFHLIVFDHGCVVPAPS